MSTNTGSLSCEGMYSKLIDDGGIQGDEAYSARPPVFVAPPTAGQRLTQRGPYRVATACLSVFCLILLLVLVAMSVHYKSSAAVGKGQNSVSQNSSSSPSTQRQKACPNVTSLNAEQKRLEEKNRELVEETNQLKAIIEKLEATPTPPPVQCTKDWLYFNGSCYFISVFGRSWRDSQTYCKGKGGHLAIIHTAEEQTFLWNLLPRGHWNSYWFGISDEKLEGDWYWVDGTKLVGGFWEDGEPNNHINEDCGYIVKTEVLSRVATKSWYDAPCYMSLPWICEKKAESTSS
ncbi:CD209 antigen-like protein C [Colossoma macropomum]|uniref:CD209 antigen-like protein C n=1 Tax=Colossoma macropomum TaxID=42526 RepID=UPI001863BED4|nr:CD209 antigen-like protein C [Colossoma macropomum]